MSIGSLFWDNKNVIKLENYRDGCRIVSLSKVTKANTLI